MYIYIYKYTLFMYRHLGSLTAANWVSFDFNVSYAGRRTDFRNKKSSDFSGEIFLERNYCPRTGFSGSNP